MLFNRFLSFDSNRLFYRITNADGKVWLMPVQNMRLALNLYQPSGKKGKLLKTCFPWLHGFPMVKRLAHAERTRCALTTELEALLGRLFQVEEPEFAVFGGTPCAHQKITMQVSKGGRILGYGKITDGEEIGALFQKESVLLETLGEKGVRGIPRCLFCGELEDGIKLFVQSTVKSNRSKVVHEWTKLHEDFLDELYRKTHRFIPFEQSDYYQALNGLFLHSDWLPKEVDSAMILSWADKVCTLRKGKSMDYSAYHADFTPWNMFVEKGKLFVFDWEYAGISYPPRLDRYHFFTQTAVFEKHWQAEEIVAYMRSPQGSWINRDLYSLYLLDVIARFTVREQGRIEGAVLRSMKIWNGLLRYMNQ